MFNLNSQLTVLFSCLKGVIRNWDLKYSTNHFRRCEVIEYSEACKLNEKWSHTQSWSSNNTNRVNPPAIEEHFLMLINTLPQTPVNTLAKRLCCCGFCCSALSPKANFIECQTNIYIICDYVVCCQHLYLLYGNNISPLLNWIKQICLRPLQNA